MNFTRRGFLAGVGGATLAYAFQVGCSPSPPIRARRNRPDGYPDAPGIDFRDWLIISSDGSVTAFTARTEMGQGLTTAMYNVLAQGFELPDERVNVVLGDTELCPADGPTTGSAATSHVVWAFWIACHRVREDLVLLAAETMGHSAEDLEYRAGEIVSKRDASERIGIGDLADGQVRKLAIDPGPDATPERPYVDKGTLNVNAGAIVTGTLQYTGDMQPEGCLYGGMLLPEFHQHQTKPIEVTRRKAKRIPDVVDVRKKGKNVIALGKSYTAVQKALDTVEVVWQEPERPEHLDNEEEIRSGAELWELIEEKGRVSSGLRASDQVVAETYITQYASQAPMETDTAIAQVEDDRTTIWIGSQSPFMVRYKTATKRKVPESRVHVIGMPMGGGFGAKAEHVVGVETAEMAELAQAPVKYVYTRRDDIQRRARYKESVIFDITSGVASDGKLQARKIDIFQDEGHGTDGVYDVPNVQTHLYRTPMPVKHATMRGTSYAQSCYALESHTDMVARSVGIDPLEFRRRNVAQEGYLPLLDACAEMMSHGHYEPPVDHGVGFGIISHGARQLGVVGAEVRVDRSTGKIKVLRLRAAYDIGLIINRNTVNAGVKGAMIWGLGYALLEEVKLDGHRCHTTGFSDYRIPRFSDTPDIELAFFNNVTPGRPRGCGEMPLPVTTAAICNAVYDAIGVRFYTLPITPERVKAALQV